MKRYGPKTVSKAHNRTALMQVLCHRASLDNLDLASLSRSYGLAVPEIDKLVAAERQRRAA